MMLRKFKLLLFLFLGMVITAAGQTISIQPVDEGPYSPGSSLAVLVKITDEAAALKADNVFKLYISDASGSFSSEKEFGSFPGFYTTYVNGIIPSGLAAGNYRLRVKSSTTSAISEASNAIRIVSGAAVLADIDASSGQVLNASPEIFGVCKPETETNFRFTNKSTSGASTTATFTNELNLSQQEFDLSSDINFKAAMTHYTIFLKSELNGIIGTKAYFLINNVIKPGFNSPSNNTVCLPAELAYDIETQSSNGIQNNFPGYSYQVNWGDDVIENFTPAQIMAEGGKVKHIYKRSSCGKQIKINDVLYYNVFGIIYQVSSPFCGLISVPVSTQAKVVTQPENRFSLPTAVCLDTEVTINNTSVAGDNPSANSPECQNNNVVYYWYVDGKPVTPQGVPITYSLKYKFTSQGSHVIRLESVSNSNCQAFPIEKSCYVQGPPKPAFDLSEKLACAGTLIKAVNRSEIDTDPRAKNTFKWVVTGPDAAFVNGTSAGSENAEIQFNASGVYTVQLTISSPCGDAVSSQEVLINSKPEIAVNWQTDFCGKDQLFTFNSKDGNEMHTSFSGTAKPDGQTYFWEISGGKFSFKNGTSEYSREPSILFEEYGAYTIHIIHQNSCGSEEITKTIRFNESPTVSAGADQTICAGKEATLSGAITNGNAASFTWKGGMGEFFPSRNVLQATYKPNLDEIEKGEVRLTLSVNTPNPAPCNVVEDIVIIKINPLNKVTSADKKSICTNTAINYDPKAIIPGSTFSWIAKGSSNAGNYSLSGTGKITDAPVNTDLEKDAEISYTIIPEKDGCTGEPFTFTVTITGTPVVKAVVSSNTICSGKAAGIGLKANFQGIRYTWTSSVSGQISGNSNRSSATAVELINDTLVNNGASAGSVTYIITPENTTGCAGKPITVTVNVSSSPGLSVFSPNKTTGCSPLAVTFSNTTPGEIHTYSWDFGDGKTLVTTNNNAVSHTYNSSVTKTFTAKLTTETDCGVYVKKYAIRVTPNTILPELVVNGDEYEGCAPHTVHFSNNSKGALLFRYDFGDGTVIETNKAPETIAHTFTTGGTYVVKLTASNGCSDTTTTETIKVYPQASTDFTADVTSGCKAVTVKFTNKSSGAKSYLWDFGDGTVSTATNPVHTFSNLKSEYDVSLITTSYFGCTDTLERKEFIKVVQPPAVDFQVLPGLTIVYPNYHFTFKNKTSGEVKSYTWDFGDGSSSSAKDAEHSYADTGSYTVRLIAESTSGCSDIQVKIVKITGTPGSLFLPNAFMPNSLTEELRVFKAKGSGIDSWQMRVFNKWGEVIWQTEKLDEKGAPVEGWDGTMHGTPVSQGVYFWEIKAKFKNGTEWPGMIYNGKEPKKIGTINLIR